MNTTFAIVAGAVAADVNLSTYGCVVGVGSIPEQCPVDAWALSDVDAPIYAATHPQPSRLSDRPQIWATMFCESQLRNGNWRHHRRRPPRPYAVAVSTRWMAELPPRIVGGDDDEFGLVLKRPGHPRPDWARHGLMIALRAAWERLPAQLDVFMPPIDGAGKLPTMLADAVAALGRFGVRVNFPGDGAGIPPARHNRLR